MLSNMTIPKWDTIKFSLLKNKKPYDVTNKIFIVVVELWGEEVQVEIIEPEKNELKFNLDEDIVGDVEICVKEVEGEDSNTIYEEYFTIK